jgi:hypothetical protein
MVLVAVHSKIQKMYSQLDDVARKARCLPAVRWRLVSVLHYSCERGHIPVALPAIAVVPEPIMVEGEGEVFEEVMSPAELMLVGEVLQTMLASAMALEGAVWVTWMMAWAAAIMGATESLVSAWVQLIAKLAVSEALVAVPEVYWKALLRILFLE